jgi:hypothetical protein
MRMTILVVAGMLAGLAPALAQRGHPPPAMPGMQGTPEDQAACGPDARRLCRSVLSDQMAVLACFQANRAKLRPACQAVLRRYGQ